ncbi:MAG TPA: HNH endonuclease signature motif containing protein [Streptosporangiaceae bacterium]|nr:HNH endonuclease signature motif containing protein [Streptosporangiaceae bacterium]
MPVSERTRKILWITAGGRCSICREQLATEKTETDDPSVFGQEAHIVAQGSTGPRAGPVDDVDGYENLILLCSKDHKRIDDQVGHFTVELLRKIKHEHEAWTRAIGESAGAAAVDEAKRRAASNGKVDEFRFSVTASGGDPTAAPYVVQGTGSKVVEIFLIRGGYRVHWRVAGSAVFELDHETGRAGRGDLIVTMFVPPDQPSDSGEELVRIDESGRHIFRIKAPRMDWELAFSPI